MMRRNLSKSKYRYLLYGSIDIGRARGDLDSHA
jgi:hypothetical protein